MLLVALLGIGLPQTTRLDGAYLKTLARDTWHCIASLEASRSGRPYDNSTRGEFTSVSNSGIYLTSVVSAETMGFITQSEASSRIERTLAGLEKLKTWFGFQQSWNSVLDLEPSKSDTAVSILDSANLCAGLLTVVRMHPEVAIRARRLFRAHDWGQFYDAKQTTLLGGYDTKKQEFNSKWHLDALGTDAALAQFFSVATGGAPISYWQSLKRGQVDWEGEKFLWPGWEGGGLFMQYISGLWLDLKDTELGNSGQAFADAQVKHMKTLGSPVWGWSACNNPDGGYLGWASLKAEVVTPHASVLSIATTTQSTIANLHALEQLGARSETDGFYDSYNWKTKKFSKTFLILDQGMILISLTNYLKANAIRAAFQSDPTVQKGRKLLGMP